MNNPLITIIITTYKTNERIIKAVNSVLNQTYKNYELIVVDDNGLDTPAQKYTYEILKPFIDKNEIIYIPHEINKNGAAARNTGIKIAKGDFITFLDDDDFYSKDRLNVFVENYNQESDFIYTNCLFYDGEYFYYSTKSDSKDDYITQVLKQESFWYTGSNMIFKSDILRKINGFDEKFLRNQDMEVMIRLLTVTDNVQFIDNYCVAKDISDNRNLPNAERFYETKIKFLTNFKDYINEQNEKDILGINFKELLHASMIQGNLKMVFKSLKIIKPYMSISIIKKIAFVIIACINKTGIINVNKLLYIWKLKKSICKDEILLNKF